MPDSPYSTLGVSPDASADEITKAYRTKAQKAHPDRDPTAGAHERFQALAIAYDILSDAGRRERYDRTGATQEGPSLESEALAYVAALVHGFLDVIEDVEHVNLVTKMREKCEADTRACRAAQTKINAHRDRRQRALARVTGAMIKWMIASQIGKYEENLARAARQIEVFERAAEIIDSHSYATDQNEPVMFTITMGDWSTG